MSKCTFILFLIFPIFLACNSNNTTTIAIAKSIDSNQLHAFYNQINDGCLVLRKGNDITSNMLAQLNLKDKRFSHVGILFTEAGQQWVYHSLGSENGQNDQCIRREPLDTFFSFKNNSLIAFAPSKLNSIQINTIHQKVKEWYAAKIPFDMDFDIKTDDKLYCTEMIAKLLQQSDTSIYFNITDTLGNQYYGVDNIFQNQIFDTLIQFKQ